MLRKLHILLVKVITWVSGNLFNGWRVLQVRLSNPGIVIVGPLRLQPDVRIQQMNDGRITFRGAAWLHRLSAIEAWGGRIIIGRNVSIGCFTMIASRAEISIGDNCMIAEGVSIRDHDHDFGKSDQPMREQGWREAPIRIGDNVWLAAKVTVLRGVTIENDVIVGANSVVTKDLPGNAIAVGIPAKIIKPLVTRTSDSSH